MIVHESGHLLTRLDEDINNKSIKVRLTWIMYTTVVFSPFWGPNTVLSFLLHRLILILAFVFYSMTMTADS